MLAGVLAGQGALICSPNSSLAVSMPSDILASSPAIYTRYATNCLSHPTSFQAVQVGCWLLAPYKDYKAHLAHRTHLSFECPKWQTWIPNLRPLLVCTCMYNSSLTYHERSLHYMIQRDSDLYPPFGLQNLFMSFIWWVEIHQESTLVYLPTSDPPDLDICATCSQPKSPSNGRLCPSSAMRRTSSEVSSVLCCASRNRSSQLRWDLGGGRRTILRVRRNGDGTEVRTLGLAEVNSR